MRYAHHCPLVLDMQLTEASGFVETAYLQMFGPPLMGELRQLGYHSSSRSCTGTSVYTLMPLVPSGAHILSHTSVSLIDLMK